MTSTRDHNGANTRSAFLCESGARICRRHADEATVHGVKAPLQAPAEQAAQLVELAVEHQAPPESREDAIRYVRAHIAEDVEHPDPRLWMVTGYDLPMSGGCYSALVLAELDRLAR